VAYTFYIDPQVNCVFIRHFNEIEPGDGLSSISTVVEDPNFVPKLNILRDMREVSIPAQYGSIGLIRRVRIQLEEFVQHFQISKFAWVVGSASDFAIAHRWSTTTRLNVDYTRNPFREISKALEWLGIAEDYEFKYPSNH
jgi:hypothetical protein